MSKPTPQAPAPPDPNQVAASQTKSNIDTANATATLNHPNQVTPWGSQTWTAGQPGPDGTPQWTSTIALDPAQQRLLDSSNRISENLANLGESQLGRVNDTLSRPVDYSGLTAVSNNPLVSTLNTSDIPALQYGVKAGELQRAPTNSGRAQTSIDTSGTENLTRNVDDSGIQSRLSVRPQDLLSAMQGAQGAAYNMQKAYLDPQYEQRQRDLENQLTQQGVLQGSDAWNKATQNLAQQRTFDYNNAFNNSFDKGLAANAQLFGQDLSSGNFVNAAQGQRFGEGMANANLNNAAAGQLNSQRIAQADLANRGQQQNYAQDLANATFNNNVQGTEFNQGQTNAALNNNTAQMLFNAKGQLAQLNNQAASQGFNQSSQLRAQQLQELLARRNQPLNELNALRTGAQVTAPSFSNGPQGNVAGTDVAGIQQQGYQNQLVPYNAQIAGNNALTSGLFSLGSAAILASDRQTKENIRLITTRADGLGVYSYNYRPEYAPEWGAGVRIGVMADEVEKVYPDAIHMHPDGYKMVNYGALH